MKQDRFESKLACSLQAIAQEAPAGPDESVVLEAVDDLHGSGALSDRNHRRRRTVAVMAASLLLIMGLIGTLVLTNSTNPPHDEDPGNTAIRSLPAPKNASVTVKSVRASSADFDKEALLGHMDSIPLEAAVTVRFPSIGTVSLNDAATSNQAWSSKVDLVAVDFAMLPLQSDCFFCVTMPSVGGRYPY